MLYQTYAELLESKGQRQKDLEQRRELVAKRERALRENDNQNLAKELEDARAALSAAEAK